MDHTRPHADETPTDPPADEPIGADDGASSGDRDEFADLYAQWRGESGAGHPPILLRQTIAEDPQAGPYLELLTGGDEAAFAGLHQLWDETQRASDVTMMGMIARPLITLRPLGGRWTVVRSLRPTGTDIPEPLDHADPVSALRAARHRLGAVVRRGGLAGDGSALVELLGTMAGRTGTEEPEPDEVGVADDADASAGSPS